MAAGAREVDETLLELIGGRNTAALKADLDALAASEQLLEHSEALQALAMTLAMTLDVGAGATTAQVAKELRATLAELRIDATTDPDRELVAGLGEPVDTAMPAKVRNAPRSRSKNVGSAGRQGARGVRNAAEPVATARTGRRARG